MDNPSPQAELQRKQLHITGIVQGVGFRPLVYRYAKECQVTGSVLNNAMGVTIEIQGRAAQVARFIEQLTTNPPPLARIDRISHQALTIEGNETDFVILHSEHDDATGAQVAVAADKSTCQDCLEDMQDPNNRHFGYAFTNCTNCGPRYTIIKALPYDRHNTAMADFAMCPECASAYQNPLDRRYHAQPVSCRHCGPTLRLTTALGERIYPASWQTSTDKQVLLLAAERLRQGHILAIKGLGGFHLVCDATNDAAVSALRQRKQRPAKPLAVMMADRAMATEYITGSAREWQVLCSQERPIVLMNRLADTAISAMVAPGLNKLGIFLPYTPLHHLLMSLFKRPMVATSANVSGEPIITASHDITRYLSHVVDAIVDHDRPIINGCDDSVVQVIEPTNAHGNVDTELSQVQVLRLARGYAPVSFALPAPQKLSILAVGAQQKNTLAFSIGNNVFLSPHIGDLFSVGAQDYFERTLATFSRLYQFSANCIVRDKHPDYAPSRWADAQTGAAPCLDIGQPSSARLLSAPQCLTVQHHHAHVLSVMAINQHSGPVLGFSFDGTGLGDDGELWGGEVLITTVKEANRLMHFEPIALLGGEMAIKQPVRLLLALLFEQMSLREVQLLPLPILRSLTPTTLLNLHKIWQHGNTLRSTSAGRLFDALACALGLIDTTLFEGQAGMALEAAAERADARELASLDAIASPALHFPLLCRPEISGSDPRPCWGSSAMFKQIITLLSEQPLTDARRDAIARAFIHALGDAVCDVAAQYKPLPIVLCGGVFQNKYLLEYCLKKLNAQGNQVLSSQQIPINDGGIALGQLWYGLHQ